MIELTGIPATIPIGFMAALGLMRVLGRDLRLPVSLGWRAGHAVLDGIEQDRLIDALVGTMAERYQAREFNWAASTRCVTPQLYRATCAAAEQEGDLRCLSFMAAFDTDAVVDKNGNLRSTRLDMSSGRQALLSDLRSLAKLLAKPEVAREAFQAALFGGGYDAGQSSYGLDPATQRSHATESRSPTKSAPLGKRGWVWLFAESLPLHPVLPLGNSRAYPAGFDNGYFWPVWGGQLYLEELAALRLLPAIGLRRLDGVLEIWKSPYYQIGKYGALASPVREPIVSAKD